MGMEKFYRTVRKTFGVEKEQMKEELKEEVTQELQEEFAEEISYIEAQMKEYEQFVAEINHMMSKMRKERVKSTSNSGQVKMDQFEDDLAPLKSKLKELEESMEERLDEQKAYS
jgi:DNA repair exonuclease SbcCD ATPase subunit